MLICMLCPGNPGWYEKKVNKNMVGKVLVYNYKLVNLIYKYTYFVEFKLYFYLGMFSKKYYTSKFIFKY